MRLEVFINNLDSFPKMPSLSVQLALVMTSRITKFPEISTVQGTGSGLLSGRKDKSCMAFKDDPYDVKDGHNSNLPERTDKHRDLRRNTRNKAHQSSITAPLQSWSIKQQTIRRH